MSPEPVRLGDALNDVKAPGGARPADIARLWRAWPALAGATVCAHVEPTSLREGVLRLRADSPVWATEVGYLAEHIRARANEVLKDSVVSEVRVWTGPGKVLQEANKEPGRFGLRQTASKSKEPGGSQSIDPQGALRSAYEAWRRSRSTFSETSERPSQSGKSAS